MIIKTKDTIAKVDKIKLGSKFNKGTEKEELTYYIKRGYRREDEATEKLNEWKEEYFIDDYHKDSSYSYACKTRYENCVSDSSFFNVLVATAYKKILVYVIDFYYRNNVVYSIEYSDLDVANTAFRSISEDIVNEDSIINL